HTTVRNPSTTTSGQVNYLRLDIITKNLISFLVFTSVIANKNIQIMTGISQALSSNPNCNNPKKLLG
ncbi:MAG: hypothetical protein ACKO1G_02360, partial [Microcystis aeruginosa]